MHGKQGQIEHLCNHSKEEESRDESESPNMMREDSCSDADLEKAVNNGKKLFYVTYKIYTKPRMSTPY